MPAILLIMPFVLSIFYEYVPAVNSAVLLLKLSKLGVDALFVISMD